MHRLVPAVLLATLVAAPALAGKPKPGEKKAQLVDSRIYQWPEDAGTVTLRVDVPMLTNLAQQIEAGTNPNLTPDDISAATEVLRAPYVVTWDLAAGTLTLPDVSVPELSHAQSGQGLNQVYSGLAQTLRGIPGLLSMLRSDYIRTDVPVTWQKADGAWRFDLTHTDGTEVVLVDPGTKLPTSTTVGAGGQHVAISHDDWQEAGANTWLPGEFSMDIGTAGGAQIQLGVKASWAKHGRTWLPERMFLTTNGQVMQLDFTPLEE